jgi:hypothetical protein
MRIIQKFCFLVVTLVASAQAQNQVAEPAPAVTGPAYDVSSGYTYLNMQIPGVGHVHLNGADVSGSIALGPRWGATLDTSYARTYDVLRISHPAYMLNAQGGPEFCPFQHGNTRIFLRALAGAALLDGAAPGSGTQFYHGWLVHPSFAVGTGFEQSVSEQFAVRVNGDYLRTSFYNYTGAVRPQNNLRLTASLVFRLKNRQHNSGRR